MRSFGTAWSVLARTGRSRLGHSLQAACRVHLYADWPGADWHGTGDGSLRRQWRPRPNGKATARWRVRGKPARVASWHSEATRVTTGPGAPDPGGRVGR